MDSTKQKIQVVVFVSGGISPVLERWLHARFDHGDILLVHGGGAYCGAESIAIRRNKVVKDFLAGKKEYDWLLMIDEDAWPLPQTDDLLTDSRPVTGCRYISKAGVEAHAGDGEVGCHFMKVSRQALLTIRDSDAFDSHRGWFAIEQDHDGTRLDRCECSYFCRLARTCGIHPHKVGRVGHVMAMVVAPKDGGGTMLNYLGRAYAEVELLGDALPPTESEG